MDDFGRPVDVTVDDHDDGDQFNATDDEGVRYAMLVSYPNGMTGIQTTIHS